MASEEWRDVPGWEGFYKVSSEGRVKRLARFVNSKNGSFALKPSKIAKGHVPKRGGYPQVALSREGKTKTLNVHRLVCEAFHGPPPTSDHEVAHRDGSRDNNRPGNLCWKTPAENAADRVIHGTERVGEMASPTKLTAGQVIEIRSRYRPRYGALAELGREFGVTRNAILSIVQRKNWKHI